MPRREERYIAYCVQDVSLAKAAGSLTLSVPSLFWQWRYTDTFPPNIVRSDYHTGRFYWWWAFYLAEVFLAIAVWIGLAQRLFPVQRIKVR